jgi:hypothetical protein
MPTPRAPEPITRCTVNLYTRDAATLKARYGQGWSGKVRALVREYLRKLEMEKAK